MVGDSYDVINFLALTIPVGAFGYTMAHLDADSRYILLKP